MFYKNKKLFHYAIIFVVSIIVSFIFLSNKLLVEQDTLFHVNRLLSLSNVLISPNNFLTFGGTGKIITTFYPSITVMIYQLFHIITNSFTSSVKLLVLTFVLISGYISYYSMNKITTKESKALVFALLYMTSQYFLSNIYIRFSLGEFAAFSFLPLVLLGWNELFYKQSSKFHYLSIGLALIVYSHVLSATLFVGLTVIVGAISLIFKNNTWDKTRWISIFYFLVFTFLLSSVIFIPLFEQLKANTIHTTFEISSFSKQTYSLLDYIKINSNNNLFYYPMGSIVIIGFIFSIFNFKNLDLFGKIIFFLSIMFIILQLNIFPWKLFDHSKLLFIQFLFRLNSFITLFVFFSFTNALFDIKFSKYDNFKFVIVIVWVSVNFIFAMQHYVTNNVKTLHRDYHNDYFYEKQAQKYFNFDYTNIKQVWYKPKSIDNKLFPNIKGNSLKKKLSLVHKTKMLIENNKFVNTKKIIDENNLQYSYYSRANNAEVILPVTLYKGIEVKVNNVTIKPKVSRFGTTQINFKGNRFIKINITYHYTIIARITQLIAIISWLVLVLVIFDIKSIILQKQ